jgi:hypothetical protein
MCPKFYFTGVISNLRLLICAIEHNIKEMFSFPWCTQQGYNVLGEVREATHHHLDMNTRSPLCEAVFQLRQKMMIEFIHSTY